MKKLLLLIISLQGLSVFCGNTAIAQTTKKETGQFPVPLTLTFGLGSFSGTSEPHELLPPNNPFFTIDGSFYVGLEKQFTKHLAWSNFFQVGTDYHSDERLSLSSSFRVYTVPYFFLQIGIGGSWGDFSTKTSSGLTVPMMAGFKINMTQNWDFEIWAGHTLYYNFRDKYSLSWADFLFGFTVKL